MIPKDLRDALGIAPGDEVTFWQEGDHVAVAPARSRRALKGRFAGSDLLGILAADRAEERARDARW